MNVALSGLATGLSLIVAIGPQNAYVLRQGLLRQHVGLVVVVCALSDIVLIAAGTAGIGAAVGDRPALLKALAWAGAAYLLWFAFTSFRSALHPGRLDASEGAAPRGRSVLATTLGLTWLNPHVYLDTVLMLGTVAAGHGDLRWTFALGAMVASVAWFTALGAGASALSGPLNRPMTWRVVDVLVGVVMVAVAIRLVTA